jgi:hypothetical protein
MKHIEQDAVISLVIPWPVYGEEGSLKFETTQKCTHIKTNVCMCFLLSVIWIYSKDNIISNIHMCIICQYLFDSVCKNIGSKELCTDTDIKIILLCGI